MSLRGMTAFLEACGATGPLVLEYTLGQVPEPAACVLHQPFAVMGHAPHADLVLTGPEVSMRHAYLQMLDGRPFLLDLDSRTGISLDGVPTAERLADPPTTAGVESESSLNAASEAAEPHASSKPRKRVGPMRKGTWLIPGQGFGLGDYALNLKEGAQEQTAEFGLNYSNPLAAQTLEAPGLPAIGLSFSKAGVDKGVWLMNCRLALLGKSPLCRVQLTGSTVSWIHCSLVRTTAGLWVVDLLSRGGIQVNGHQVRYAQLQAGDRITLGRFEVAIKGEAPLPISATNAVAFPESFSPPVPPMTFDALPESDIAPPPIESFSDAPLEPFAHGIDEFPEAPIAGALEWGSLLPAVRPVQAMTVNALPGNGMPQSFSESLLQRFESMQQQMVDEFHQALSNMVQTFGQMQQEEIAHRNAEWNEMRQEQLTRIQRDLKDVRHEELEQLQQQFKELREQEHSQVHAGLKEMREQETVRIHERLQQLHEEEATRIMDRLKQLHEEGRGQIHEGLKELRAEESARMQQRLHELQAEERGRIEDRLKQLREEERGQIHEGLKELRQQEIAQIQERLHELRREESCQIQESLMQLRAAESSQIQSRLEELRDKERAQMHMELKGLREEHMSQVQVALKGLREEELAWVQQGISQLREEERGEIRKELEGLHELNRRLEELRSQLAAPPLKAPASPGETRPEKASTNRGVGTMEQVAAYLSSPRPATQAPAPEPPRRHTPIVPTEVPPAQVPEFVRVAPGNAPDPEQKHKQAELSMRIAALQEEKQSLWRKIVGALHGGGGGR
jgi:pSer/pThr/pTyr-binding forkhead associated (FHA) protein